MNPKKKKLLIIILAIVGPCFIALTLFSVFQGFSSAEKREEYFDVYRAKAVEYLTADEEMIGKYGEDFKVRFDTRVTYHEPDGAGFWGMVKALFISDVPDSIEEFNERVDMIEFKVYIADDAYEIKFEKNTHGELVVTSLTAVEL